jgi:hypothetical protein
LAILLGGCASSRSNVVLLSLWEDKAGYRLKTRELDIFADGRVVEETNDFKVDPPAYQKRNRRRLSSRQLRRIVAVLDRLRVCDLPERVPSALPWLNYNDPTRMLIYAGPLRNCGSEWHQPFSVADDETERFARMWAFVLRTIEGPHPVQW